MAPLSPSPSARLLPALRDRLRTKRYSERTVEAYASWVRRFVRFHGMRHPAALGPAEVEAFLTDLATRAHVASATQNQALAAIVFMYREVLDTPTGWLRGSGPSVPRTRPCLPAPILTWLVDCCGRGCVVGLCRKRLPST